MDNYTLLYQPEHYEKRFQQSHFCSKKLGYRELENHYIVPIHETGSEGMNGGVYSAEYELLRETGFHRGSWNGEKFDSNHAIDRNETVVYCGSFSHIWGHILTDCIRLLWFLKSDEFKEKYGQCKLVYLPMPKFMWFDSFKSFLSVLGFSYEQFTPITEITRFKKIILPDESFFFDENDSVRYWTKEYQSMIDCVRDWGRQHKKETGIDKIFFSYTKSNVYGMKNLENFFKVQGYKIIHPENYTFAEQINLLLNCKCLASPEGSCSHNSMFMEDGADLIIIPRGSYITGYQLAINDMSKLNVNWIDSSLSITERVPEKWCGPFYFYVSENLMRFFNYTPKEKAFWKKNLKGFRHYFYQSVNRRNFSESNNKTVVNNSYYSNVFLDCMQKYTYSKQFFTFNLFIYKQIERVTYRLSRLIKR